MDVIGELWDALRGPEGEALLRILLAGVLCALIGLEREIEGKPAGVRTYGLVGMGAAMFTAGGSIAFGEGEPASRVGAAIVTGIGFLGAGTILHMERRVVGLTTAAGLWAAAALGMVIGTGLYVLGIGAALALFIVLQFLRPEVLIRLGLASEEDVKGEVTTDKPRKDKPSTDRSKPEV